MKGAAALALGLASDAQAEAPQSIPGSGASAAGTVSGIVYESSTGEPHRAGLPGVAGVLVSNGREVVRTDAQGRYTLPIDDEAVIFVIKPSGYAVPTDPATNLPRFYFIHQLKGTPADLKLRFRGIDPTGPLPESVDFPLIRQAEKTKFDVLLFTDPQPESHVELDFVRDDVVNALVGSNAAFGITTGDILFDDLSMYGRYNRIIGQIGLPWWNIGGNHDLNFEAKDRTYSRETYKQVFGAPYYAFHHGDALFLMLDNVTYLGPDPSRPADRGGKYIGEFGSRQLAFVENVLKETPKDKLVVACMHIPLESYVNDDPANGTADRNDFLKLFAGRKVLSLAGHTHTTEHHYFDIEGCWQHHHHVLTAVSGSWWSGPFDYRGIACALSRDGSPNGHHVLSIDGTTYETRFVAAKEPQGRKTRIMLDSVFHRSGRELQRDFRLGQMLGSPISVDTLHATEVIVNVFDGGPKTKVALTIGKAAPIAMTRDARPDPLASELFARNEATKKPWVKAENSSHIWTARLPSDLEPGSHTLTVTVQDEYGRAFSERAVVEVVCA
ncbi:MAG TPA: calcineurin-like phosphoesterase family protein [Geobacterales bacterium]|nr:calcineurin-like phosphoesterase family protein [Geobacterales bacterium]